MADKVIPKRKFLCYSCNRVLYNNGVAARFEHYRKCQEKRNNA